ncbi:MAG: hypothetical protein Alis3KO_01050 [Aliiglaciecola sp.]
MIERPFSQAGIDSFKQSEIRPLAFVDLDWNGERVRAHSGLGTRPFLGQDYLGVGEFGGISKLTEKPGESANTLTLTLKILDPAIVALVTNEPGEGGDVFIHMANLNAQRQIEHELPYLFDGYIIRAGVKRGDVDKGIPAILSITCADWMENWNKPSEMAYISDGSQQYKHPGDRIFDLVETIAGTPAHALPTKSGTSVSQSGGRVGGRIDNSLYKQP